MSHVPNDMHETMEFERTAREFADSVAAQIVSEHKELGFLRLKLGGSFADDTKTENIDHFCYMCLVESAMKGMTLSPRENAFDFYGILKYGSVGPENIYETIRRLLNPLRTKNKKIYVKNLYLLGATTNVILSWFCTRKHQHILHIEFTLACELDISLRSWLAMHKRPEYTWFKAFERYLEDVKILLIGMSKQKWEFSSCSFDRPIQRYLNDTCSSEAIRLVRCVKLLCKMTLPDLFVKSKSSIRGFHITPYMNSYTVKSFVFQQWHLPGNEAMRINNMMVQLNKCFCKLHKDKLGSEIWLDTKDFITGQFLGTNINSFDMLNIDHDSIVQVFTSSPFVTVGTSINWQPEKVSFSSYDQFNMAKAYFVVRGRYHAAKPSAEFCLNSPISMYRLPKADTMPLYKHRIVKHCLNYRINRILTDKGLDLTKPTPGMSFPLCWLNYCSGTITFNDCMLELEHKFG